jgi:hypothetical protein
MLRFQATGTVEMHSPRDRRLVVILLPCRVRQILAGSGRHYDEHPAKSSTGQAV